MLQRCPALWMSFRLSKCLYHVYVCLIAWASVGRWVYWSVGLSVFPSVCLFVRQNKWNKYKPSSSYFSPWVTSPFMLTCSLRKNSWPFNFFRTSLDTNSQPSTDWMHDKLLSSLPEESWSSQSVGISLLDVKHFPGLPGGVAFGASVSWNENRQEYVTCLLHLWLIPYYTDPRNAL